MVFLLVVTLVSMLLAAVMSAIAWRLSRAERLRSEARIAALAADIQALPDAALPHRAAPHFAPSYSAPSHSAFSPELPLRHTAERVPVTDTALFASETSSAAPRRLGTIAVIGALAFGALLAIVYVMSGSGRIAPTSGVEAGSRATPHAPMAPSAPLPLELIALGHDRDGDTLTVRGVVRNPSAGGEVDKVTAVVYVFGRDGAFLASGRAAIESQALRPGGESTFVVRIPDANDVGRYRVSFRTDDRVVPHVDRRQLHIPGQETS